MALGSRERQGPCPQSGQQNDTIREQRGCLMKPESGWCERRTQTSVEPELAELP
jgi:hypothetical protein